MNKEETKDYENKQKLKSEKPSIRKMDKAIPYSISYSLLGLLVIVFLLGGAAYGLFQNMSSQQTLTFSTPALIGFVLTIILAGASIVLAVSAIMLGKFSEQAMIKRSDESIRIQNEVFQKTTDALQRIESSTGVTEKRIEDIISGRVGDISQNVARIATEKREGEVGLNIKELEETIQRSILETLGEGGIAGSYSRYKEADLRRTLEQRERQEKEDAYKALHTRMLKAFSTRDDLTALQMGTASLGATGDGLFDGIYQTEDGNHIGVIDFAPHHQKTSVSKFTSNSLHELSTGYMSQAFILLYEPVDKEKEVAFDDAVATASPEIKERILLVKCVPDRVEEVVKGLSITKTPDAGNV